MAQSLVVMTQQVWAGVIRQLSSLSTPPCSSFLCSGKQLVAVHKAVMDLTADMGFLWFFESSPRGSGFKLVLVNLKVSRKRRYMWFP